HAVVGGFASDDDVMDVRLAKTGGGDADELGFFGEIFERGRADVPHAALQAADELIAKRGERAFVGDAALDAFGDGFAAVGLILHDGVPVGTGVHGSDGAHAAIGLESAALVENRFAGRFFRAGEEATDHYARRASSDGFGDVAGILDATIR